MEMLKKTYWEVFYGIIPISAVVLLMQFTFLRLPWDVFFTFVIGVLMVASGLFLFLLGVEIGLLPMGEFIGAALPRQGKLSLIILFSFLLGFAVTAAEPDLRVLASQVDQVSDGRISNQVLVYTVAVGVGFFVTVSTLRMLYQLKMSHLLMAGYALVFLLIAITPPVFVPVSFDAGGVTTGPMTVPFILALGVGISSVFGGKKSTADGFGYIGLASLGPVLAVLLLGVFYQ